MMMSRPASISVVLIASRPAPPPRALAQALARGDALEVVPAIGPFDEVAGAFASALARCRGEVVFALTPDSIPADEVWAAIAEACAVADVAAVSLTLRGLVRDPASRHRRRARDRNPETLRFANLAPPGGLALRRDAAMATMRQIDPEAGGDWWRQLAQGVAARGRVEQRAVVVRRRALMPAEPRAGAFAPPAPVGAVLVLGQLEVTASLYFDFLQSIAPGKVTFRPFTSLEIDAPHLAAAGLVVLVRELHRFHDDGVIAFLQRIGVPYVYFTDDNFPVLRAEGLAGRYYRPERMRAALAGAAEVWVSTAPLAEATRPLHPRIRIWGPVLDPILARPPPRRAGPLTIAFAGGGFRVPRLIGPPLERLRRLSESGPLRLVLTPDAARQVASLVPAAEVVVAPIERSFRQFIYAGRSLGIDILMHPAGATANAPYKCATAAITAGYLGAIPLVDEEPAYSGWDEADGLLRFGDEARGLDEAVAAARDAARRTRLGERLAASLARRFADAGRWQTLQALAADRGLARPGPDVLSEARFRARRAALGIARRSRWLRDRAAPRG
jgi:hypothetical protein